MSDINNFRLEGAEVLSGRYRNFAGAPDTYNKQGGKRYFNVVIDDELAERLSNDGWNVKIQEPREEGDKAKHFLKVNISLAGRTTINRIVRGGRPLKLDEITIEQLDTDRIEFADLSVRAYEYEPGKISAWLSDMNVYVSPSGIGIREDWDVDEVPFE